jgi:polar amino acid transport system ATP-binding protein
MNAPASLSFHLPLVDIRGLRKRYGSNEVLKGVDLQINRSEVVSIIGKSGSGKSTLLRCINGLETFRKASCWCMASRCRPTTPNPCASCARTWA